MRSGEIHDGEIIEISGSERFERCRFFDCVFTGNGSVTLHDCEIRDSCDFSQMRKSAIVLEKCFISTDPPDEPDWPAMAGGSD